MNSKFEFTFGVNVKLKKRNKILFLELECVYIVLTTLLMLLPNSTQPSAIHKKREG